ncbi:DNA gyrase subunit A [Lacticaseibacillus mingshuiensis]|uniref:DNA gyrase subunit A n=1 Tax=Lacticaseibacillus mingshuiensis TaxID=2799574 RepID=UPI00194FE1B7|nr:DNA gyrase subunit A [Lacticaseibacillus mingshuiensis]
MDDRQESRITNVNLAQTMKTSFLDYAMSVIVARALPDVRDGLKPVQRRILYGMNELGVTPDKPYKKSARIVGDVMGKYHPHGDSSIYEGLVRMAQDFSYRYMLVDGHGNFGSVDGDGAAAMRYTEARMSRITLEMLRDINKDTIDYTDNYDGTEKEPVVLPARFPNLLVNGATGIAVGMTTNIPPHNLAETISALHLLMDDPDVTTADLMTALPGPDFPTGGLVLGKAGIRRAYETGRGTITVRAKTEIETSKTGKETIIVTEIPYMVNKARLVERIAELAREKKIDGITDLNDESDRDGMRITIDVRRDMSASVVLNNLFKLTPMQTGFSYNMVAIVNGEPRTLSLKEILQYYLKHQESVIRRRTEFDLKKAEARAHILEGLKIALDHIDEIISIIRGSQTGDAAKVILMDKFKLSDKQSQAILDMRLVRLTGLEREKVENEYNDVIAAIADFKDILAKPERVHQIIYEELLDIQKRFGDKRRTELLVGDDLTIEDEDLIEEQNVVITLTHNGYVKRLPAEDFKAQNRGGRGIQATGVHDDDFVEHLVSTSTHDFLLFFTNTGKVYRSKGYEIPEYGRSAKGIPIINLLGISNQEKVQTVINVTPGGDGEHYLFFITKNGIVKRTPVKEFFNIRKNGLIALHMKDGDELSNVIPTDGTDSLIVATRLGYSVHFKESDIRSMSRIATGVRGIRLRDSDYVIGSDVLRDDEEVFVISENGYGKRTAASEYPTKGRGGKGIKTANVTEKNGPLAGMVAVDGSEDIMVMTDSGVTIRFNIQSVSQTGRSTLGVRLMRVDDGAKVVAMTKVEPEPDEPDSPEAGDQPSDGLTSERPVATDGPVAEADDGATTEENADTTEYAGDADQQVQDLLNRAETDADDDDDAKDSTDADNDDDI